MTSVSRCHKTMMAMLAAVSASMVASSAPCIHAPAAVLKLSSCATAKSSARPLMKPSITGCGTSRMNLPSRATLAPTCTRLRLREQARCLEPAKARGTRVHLRTCDVCPGERLGKRTRPELCHARTRDATY